MHKFLKTSLILLLFLPNLAFSKSSELYNQGDFNSAFREAFKQSMAGEKEGDYILGRLYLFGQGAAKKNIPKSLEYFNKAIKKGSAKAAIFLAEEYQNGKNLKKNFAESRRLFIIASKLGGGDFSKAIASLSQQLSDDQLTKTSCVDAMKAAENNDRSNYLYYIRCMIQEEGVSRDIDKINKLVNKIKDKPREEEIFQLSSILISGPDGVKNPFLAYNTIEQFLANNNTNSKLKDKLTQKLKTIQFSISNCKNALKNNSNSQIKFICGKVEESTNSKSLISLFEIYEKNSNIFNNYQDKKIKILSKAISYNDTEALDKLENYFLNKAQIGNFLEFLSKEILSNKISSEMKSALNDKINRLNSDLVENISPNNIDLIYDSILNNNCNLLDKFVNKVRYDDITKLSEEININKLECTNSKNFNLLKAISFKNNLEINQAFNLLGKLCTENVKHSCFVLSDMYLTNNLPKSQSFLDKDGLILTAIDLLNRSIGNGNIDAYIPLSELMLANNKDVSKAKELLDIAVSKGEFDGLYLKSWYDIKQRGIFSGSEKTCKPLRLFLGKNITSSKYYTKAIKLYNEKCK